jgi:methylmalonyl-CoA mutase, N-terminal domain
VDVTTPFADRVAEWEARATAAPVRPAETDSGIPVKLAYTSLDLPSDIDSALGLPGEPPFTRGIYPTMYRGRLWTMRLYSGFATADDTNERFRYLLSQGQTGLSVALDLPTQLGLDSDDPTAEGEIGRVGVAIDTLDDMAAIFDGIPLAEVSTSFTINATAPILLAMYIVVAERQGVDRSAIRGTVQNDILKEYIARNTYIYPPRPSVRLAADVIEYCSRELPAFNPISVCGYHMRQAGADAVQEIAFTLADALVYVDHVIERGTPIDDFAPQLSFNMATMSDLFEEVAKHRATRRLWASLVSSRYQPRDPRSQMFRFFSGGDGTSLTAAEPLNNIVRVTLHQLGVVLGGAQAVHTVAYDEALGIPTQDAALVALRTQQIIAHESGVPNVVDPLAGSYYVEALTDELERRARDLLAEIELHGGMIEAIASGWVNACIDERAFRLEQEMTSGQRVIVGVNRFVDDGHPGRVPVFGSADEARRTASRQLTRLATARARRDASVVQSALGRVTSAAAAGDNVMPRLVDAVRVGGTVGEISRALGDVFGYHRDVAGTRHG